MNLKDDAVQPVLAGKTHQQERRSHLEGQAELAAQLKAATGKQRQAVQVQAAAEQHLQHSQGELCSLSLSLQAGPQVL